MRKICLGAPWRSLAVKFRIPYRAVVQNNVKRINEKALSERYELDWYTFSQVFADQEIQKLTL